MTKQALKKTQAHFEAKSRWLTTLSADSLYKETPAAQKKRISRLLCPKAYGRFFDYYFGLQTTTPLAEASSAPFHVAAYQELYENEWLIQFRLWFRGAAKSMQTNVGNAFALKCKNRLRFMLLVASSEWRAKLLLSDLQAQFESNQRIIKDFGPQIQYGNWRDGAFETKDGCYFMALGIGQPFRGLRRYANRIDFAVVDDIEDRKHVANRMLIRARVDKVVEELGAAFQKSRQRLVISNNYITREGVIAGLLDRLKDNKHMRVSKVNLADEHGKPSWPSYYSSKDVARIHDTHDPYVIKREYYNTPIEQGRLFDEERLRFAPLPEVSASLVVGFWDFSYTTHGDFKAFALVGLYGDIWYVLSIFCRQCDMLEAMGWYFQLSNRWLKEESYPYIYYDASVIQEHIFTPLMRQEAARQQYHGPLPLPYKKLRAEKHARIEMSLQTLLLHDQLRFATHLQDQADTRAAFAQLLAFEPGMTTYDDFPDALAAALHIGSQRRIQHEVLVNEESYFFGQRQSSAQF